MMESVPCLLCLIQAIKSSGKRMIITTEDLVYLQVTYLIRGAGNYAVLVLIKQVMCLGLLATPLLRLQSLAAAQPHWKEPLPP